MASRFWSALAARRLRLPYTVGLVLAGAALAATRSNAGLALTHDLIFDVVLPPLLFEAALNLSWSDLRRDLVPVVALSTLGAALCALLRVAGGLIAGLGWSIESALVFGALISATDLIAVIALIKESRVALAGSACSSKPRAYSTTAPLVVFFTLILVWAAHDPGSAQGPPGRHHDVWRRRWRRPCRRVRRRADCGDDRGKRLDDHLVEEFLALTAVAAFGSSLPAEHFGASGVLATVAAGMTMGNLGVLMPRERFGLSA